ncbi:hypothetical protein GM415_10280 [Pseudodesulfovibrio cashew]|uniref:Uncharacterized protein n=1 Tax=Pseudodesulfovibrio cashew TaxID=2678688 RepID=A0A6I6JSG6_9BACT|nr:hypothetical protein [Pseudodesulfovibrio cashew]QGY40494.1 hypothetical protein GM415_10280 [Pseudodesulfovibrio cashew]
MELEQFIAEWTEDPAEVKPTFLEYKNLLESLEDTKVHFIARPGITFSLRGEKTSQDKRPLFVMVDVIDDDPADRWLSVCFYGETITDPDELGDFVPGGLLGEDGHCFDVDSPDVKDYIAGRIREAHANQ